MSALAASKSAVALAIRSVSLNLGSGLNVPNALRCQGPAYAVISSLKRRQQGTHSRIRPSSHSVRGRSASPSRRAGLAVASRDATARHGDGGRAGRTATWTLPAEHKANQKKEAPIMLARDTFGASRRGTQGYGRSDAAPSARCVR